MTAVIGLGADGAPQAYSVTAEAIQLSHNAEDEESVLLHGQGETLSDGLDDTVSITGRTLHCNHAQILVVSRDLAEKGIEPLLLELLTHSRYPASLQMAVSKCAAAQMMETKPVVGDLGSTELDKLICQGERDGLAPSRSVTELYQDIQDEGIEGILPFVILRQNGENTVRQIDGTALFCQDRMVSIVDQTLTPVLLWMRGEACGEYTVQGEQLVIRSVRTRIDCDGTQAKIGLRIAVSSQTGDTSLLEQAFLAQASNDMHTLLSHLQKVHCDAIGIGREIRRKDARLWERLKADWPECFSRMPVSFELEICWKGQGRAKWEGHKDA